MSPGGGSEGRQLAALFSQAAKTAAKESSHGSAGAASVSVSEGQQVEAEVEEGAAEEAKSRQGSLLADHRAEAEAQDGPAAVISSKRPVAAARFGDVLRISHLLKMANAHLDEVPEGWDSPLRYRGGVVVVQITYTNRAKWQLWPDNKEPPWYSIEVTKRPVYNFRKREELLAGSHFREEARRSFVDYHGVRVIVEQTGELVTFDLLNVLVVLAASLSLLAVANAGTDFLAFSILAKKDQYAEVKYDVSKDLGDGDET